MDLKAHKGRDTHKGRQRQETESLDGLGMSIPIQLFLVFKPSQFLTFPLLLKLC